MRARTTGLLVETYQHGTSAQQYEIRYDKAKKDHFVVFGQETLRNVSFDELKAELVKRCEKAALAVWVPAIEISSRTTERMSVQNGSSTLNIARFELAQRDDGELIICDWELTVYERGVFPNRRITHDQLTDELKAKYGHNQEMAQADKLMASLAENQPYRLILEEHDYDRAGDCKMKETGKLSNIIWMPYTEPRWQALLKIVARLNSQKAAEDLFNEALAT